MAGFTLLGAIDEVVPLALQVAKRYGPGALEFVSGPGLVSRIGDAVVWNGGKGQTVIAALDGLAEGQDRITAAISGVESLQLASNQALGVVQTFSMATLGITSLTGIYMAMRLTALNQRLSHLERRIKDVEAHLKAQDKAHLLNGVQTLRSYEQKENPADLKRAREEAQHAANIYGDLAAQEAADGERLAVLNYRSRYFMLALLTELQCMLLDESHQAAVDRIAEERPKLKQIAKMTFAKSIGQSPAALLDPNLANDGVTLELMTELYRQAKHADAIEEVEIRDANDMFEHVRHQVFGARRGLGWLWRPSGKARKRLLCSVRYAATCLEDTNRLIGLDLLIKDLRAKNLSFRDLVRQLREWRADQSGVASTHAFAYTMG